MVLCARPPPSSTDMLLPAFKLSILGVYHAEQHVSYYVLFLKYNYQAELIVTVSVRKPKLSFFSNSRPCTSCNCVHGALRQGKIH